jgi:hypothetical protein
MKRTPQRIADRYVARDGGPPEPQRSDFGINEMAIAKFITSHNDTYERGGIRAIDAFAALCRLTGSRPERLRAVVRQRES